MASAAVGAVDFVAFTTNIDITRSKHLAKLCSKLGQVDKNLLWLSGARSARVVAEKRLSSLSRYRYARPCNYRAKTRQKRAQYAIANVCEV